MRTDVKMKQETMKKLRLDNFDRETILLRVKETPLNWLDLFWFSRLRAINSYSCTCNDMSCNGICHTHRATKPRNASRYENGQKRCSLCAYSSNGMAHTVLVAIILWEPGPELQNSDMHLRRLDRWGESNLHIFHIQNSKSGTAAHTKSILVSFWGNYSQGLDVSFVPEHVYQ